jgi:mannose-6-phosphate isomerase
MIALRKTVDDPRHWLETKVYPLWSGVAIDPATGVSWEALDHAGRPLRDIDRRLRVQARQAYCFASAGRADLLDLGERQFRFAMDQGIDPATGHLVALFDSRLGILSAPHDLYDLAFMLLAASALLRRGRLRADDLPQLEAGLARLKAPRGWHENAAHLLPRRQNPHMHLFEAATELYRVTRAPRHLAIADECLALLRDVFLRPDGRLLEYHAVDLTPVPTARQSVEPGHMAEWVYLLHRYERVTGRCTGISLGALFRAVRGRQLASGFLPDTSQPLSRTRRLWPQLEFLRAAMVMYWRGHRLAPGDSPSAIMDRIRREYLTTDVPGGWFDQRDAQGALCSRLMPASTLYHVQLAIRAYCGGE